MPVAIGPASGIFGATWEDDGTIIYAEGNSILRIPEAGGMPEVVVGDLKGIPQTPQMLPGGAVLFTLVPQDNSDEPEIVVRSLASGEQKALIRGGMDARYLRSGHLVYFAAGTLLAVPFDAGELTVRGAPVAAADNIATGSVPGRVVGVAHFDVSRSGTLAYIAGSLGEITPRTITWVDRRGREEPLGAPPRPYLYPRLSPDGTRLALTIRDLEQDIWIWDMGRKTLSRATFDPADDRYSTWTPDGRRIAFGSSRGGEAGLWWQAADGTGTAERLAGFPAGRYTYLLPTSISPGGSLIVATATPSAPGIALSGSPDLWLIPLDGHGQPAPLLQTSFSERNAEISPDGRWVAYESAESGRFEVYVRPFPDLSGGKWQVSTDGGLHPHWSHNGDELFFVDARASASRSPALSGGLMSVRVERGAPLTASSPTKVLDGPYVWTLPAFGGRLYDVSPDGDRFLVLKDAASGDRPTGPTGVTVVQNWLEELKRLAPTN